MVKKKKHPKLDIAIGDQGNIILDDISLLKALHFKYYHSELYCDTWWNGVKVYKCVFDLWVYQEIINELKPDIIIETGTGKGGSALYMAHIFDTIHKGFIYTIDIKERKVPQHKRIYHMIGSSIDKKITGTLKKWLALTPGRTVMVILDSDHHGEHVREELKIYSEFVTKGQYLIVEDTNLTGHPIGKAGIERGPYEAVEEFLKKDKRFAVDRSREKFGLTFNPQGYLRRIK